MRRLSSPSALFLIWTLLFLLPALPLLLVHRTSLPPAQFYIAYPARAMMAPFAFLAALLPLIRWAPPSYPFFAIVFALWPKIVGLALDARLGRWQFALATVPLVLGVLTGAIVIGSSKNATNFEAVPALLPAVFQTTVEAVLAFWILSILVFMCNVVRTIRTARGCRHAAVDIS